MALDIDGFAVLKRIGAKPELFSAVAIEAKEFTRKLAAKQIERTRTLKDLKALCRWLGKDTFALLSDGLSDAALRRIVKLVDPYGPEPSQLRRHFIALASNELKPSTKPRAPRKVKESGRKSASKRASGGRARSKKSAASKKEKETPPEPTGFFWGTAMGARRKR